MKPRSYVFSNKVWLNSKYIKTKQNYKLVTKFFGLFQVFYLVKNQVYKLKLPKKYSIYDIFYVTLLEYNTLKKRRMNKINTQLGFEARNNSKEYKVKKI